jgi:hypothetical protein
MTKSAANDNIRAHPFVAAGLMHYAHGVNR